MSLCQGYLCEKAYLQVFKQLIFYFLFAQGLKFREQWVTGMLISHVFPGQGHACECNFLNPRSMLEILKALYCHLILLDFPSISWPGSCFSSWNHSHWQHWCCQQTAIIFILLCPRERDFCTALSSKAFWKRWEYQTTWPASWETCMQVRKQQLELDMEQHVSKRKRSTSSLYIVTLLT